MGIGNRPNNYTFYEGYEDENAIVDNKVVLYFHCAQQGRKISLSPGCCPYDKSVWQPHFPSR